MASLCDTCRKREECEHRRGIEKIADAMGLSKEVGVCGLYEKQDG